MPTHSLVRHAHDAVLFGYRFLLTFTPRAKQMSGLEKHSSDHGNEAWLLVLLQGDKLLFLTENFKAKQGNFVRAGS
jgi:hypothetical protein